MTRFLFIGGAHDGQRIDIDLARDVVRLPVRQSFSYRLLTVETRDDEIMRYDIYKRMEFRGEKNSVFVYALEKMTPDDVLLSLLVGYKTK